MFSSANFPDIYKQFNYSSELDDKSYKKQGTTILIKQKFFSFFFESSG